MKWICDGGVHTTSNLYASSVCHIRNTEVTRPQMLDYFSCMSYVVDFVKSFTDAELLLFKKLDVTGKEEAVRDEYVRSKGNKNFSEAQVCKRLQISQTHLDKINSVLLNKTVYALYGDDYYRALSGILQKGLTALFFHELKITERRILRLKETEALAVFYRAAFENLRSMFHPAYNAKLTQSFGERYLKALGSKKTTADECYVSMMVLYGNILQADFAGGGKFFSPIALKQIQQSKQRYYGQVSDTCDFYIDFTEAAYQKHLAEDATAFVDALERAYKHCKNADAVVQQKYEGIVLCELGFGLMCINRFEEAKRKYAEAFKKFPDTLGKTFYHAGNYFATALCDKDYGMAQEVFDRHLRPRIQPATNRSVLFDIYFMAVWLQLHVKNYVRAAEYLRLLQQYKRTEITLMGQAMLRQVECAYFFLKDDAATAYTVTDRNLRQLKKMYAQSPTFEYYYHYVDVIHQLLRLQKGVLRFPDKLREQLEALPSGLNQVYNLPLQEAAAKLLPK